MPSSATVLAAWTALTLLIDSCIGANRAPSFREIRLHGAIGSNQVGTKTVFGFVKLKCNIVVWGPCHAVPVLSCNGPQSRAPPPGLRLPKSTPSSLARPTHRQVAAGAGPTRQAERAAEKTKEVNKHMPQLCADLRPSRKIKLTIRRMPLRSSRFLHSGAKMQALVNLIISQLVLLPIKQ